MATSQAAEPIESGDQSTQLALNARWTTSRRASGRAAALCAGCRQHEARYGFRPENAEPGEERPRTLCFACFRMELDRRQSVAARLARGWNAEQARLPLEETLQALDRRRRRAQIAARKAMGE
jgi:hypothetical protein